MKYFSIILTIAIVGVSFILIMGRISWKQYIDEKYVELKKSSLQQVAIVDLKKETVGLPGSVKRYFNLVLNDGVPMINRAQVAQYGGFRAKPEMTKWSQMEAEQLFLTNPRAFIWNSTISMVPGVSINVCDSYIDGQGEMKGRILSAFTLIYEKNKKELNEGALQRHLAESVWFPTALLPSQGVVWKELDEFRAEASIVDSGNEVSLEFEFNEKGEIVSVYTPKRYREVDGKYEPTPWKGTFSNYTNVDGYFIPKEGEVSWLLLDGAYSYWKASLVSVEYE